MNTTTTAKRPTLTLKQADRIYNAAADRQAKREGWAVFTCDDGKLHIQRLDEGPLGDDGFPLKDGQEPRFSGDPAAVAFVRRQAAKGSTRHMAALVLAGRTLPVIRRSCKVCGVGERKRSVRGITVYNLGPYTGVCAHHLMDCGGVPLHACL